MWMAGSIASFLAMSIAGRATTAELNVFQVLELRSVIGFVMLLPLVYPIPLRFNNSPRQLKKLNPSVVKPVTAHTASLFLLLPTTSIKTR